MCQTEINSCRPRYCMEKWQSIFLPALLESSALVSLMLSRQIIVMKVFFCSISYFLCDPQASLNQTLKTPSVCHQPCPFFLAPLADLPCLYIEIVTRIEYSIPHGEVRYRNRGSEFSLVLSEASQTPSLLKQLCGLLISLTALLCKVCPHLQAACPALAQATHDGTDLDWKFLAQQSTQLHSRCITTRSNPDGRGRAPLFLFLPNVFSVPGRNSSYS